jgi:hypothetical protein
MSSQNKSLSQVQSMYDGPYPDASSYDSPEDDLQYPLECDATFYERREKRRAEMERFSEAEREAQKIDLQRSMEDWKKMIESKENVDPVVHTEHNK